MVIIDAMRITATLVEAVVCSHSTLKSRFDSMMAKCDDEELKGAFASD